jgi:hypothetical protein
MTKGTGILGFMDYTSTVTPQGYHKSKTDKVINTFRKNEKGYQERIRELEQDVQIVTMQRNALKSLFNEYMDKHGISDETLEQDWERHLNMASEDL